MPETDMQLLDHIRHGDRTALGVLFDRLADQVYAVAYYLLGNRGDAEEVVEAVFAQVWAESSSYHVGDGSVATWIILIARSLALGRLR